MPIASGVSSGPTFQSREVRSCRVYVPHPG